VVEQLLPGHEAGAGLEGGGGPEGRAARLPVVERQGGHLGLEDVVEEGGGVDAGPVRGPGQLAPEVDREEGAEELEFGGDRGRHQDIFTTEAQRTQRIIICFSDSISLIIFHLSIVIFHWGEIIY